MTDFIFNFSVGYISVSVGIALGISLVLLWRRMVQSVSDGLRGTGHE